MFESATSMSHLALCVSDLARLSSDADDAERVDQLDWLERAKAACSAAQARITVDLAESQAQVAQEWREHALVAADAGDFDAWRQARAQARVASCEQTDTGDRQVSAGASHRSSHLTSDGVRQQ